MTGMSAAVAIQTEVQAVEWHQRLLQANGAADLVAAINDIASPAVGVARHWLVRDLGQATLAPGVQLPSPSSHARAAASRIGMQAGPALDAETGLLAFPLPASSATVVLQPSPVADGKALLQSLQAPLQALDRLLARELKLAGLSSEVARLQHSEKLQRALFAISELAGSDR